MLVFGILRLVYFLMECLCIAPLTPALMVIRGLVFHPLVCKVLISGSYLVCLCVRARSRNLSWQYVNSLSWTVYLGDGVRGVGVWDGAPIMHRMSGRNILQNIVSPLEHCYRFE